MEQIGLFDGMLEIYGKHGSVSNGDLYKALCDSGALDADRVAARIPIGKSGDLHSPAKRSIRWYQQTLRGLGLLERESRGVWKLTQKGEGKLTEANATSVLVGFSTDLGVALWAMSESALGSIGEPIDLVMSSLPYPLAEPRRYGNPSEMEYVDWACALLEPLIGQMAPHASLVLNLGNDIFERGLPSRSMYVERLTLALNDRFGMRKMDSIVWMNTARPPGPMQWASRTRQQLNATYEPILWMSRNPEIVCSDNRRVLLGHTERHRQLLSRGGEKRSTEYGDGAHKVRPGAYGNATEGRIPRNVIAMPHNCQHKSAVAKLARQAGLPVHGATMPLKLAKFLIEFLTEKNQLVADPCAGWMTTPMACEQTQRRWIAAEKIGEYVLGAALGFRSRPGFQCMGSLA